DLEPAAKGIAEVLPDAAIAQIRGEPREILGMLERHAPDVVFNLCEAPLCRLKDRTAAVLAAAGVPVPRRGRFPCIVKPADQDGSAGIDHDSICADDA